MKYCTNCGNELLSDAAICHRCGFVQEAVQTKSNKDKWNVLWFVLSFLWWWVGLILYFDFRRSNAEKAKTCLNGMIGGLVFTAVLALMILTFFG